MGESHLSRLAARGDARAFEAIFRRHHQELYRYCRAIVSDPDDAQDALQGTMTAALRALPGERREIALRPWLFRVAHNEAISIARGRREAPAAEQPERAVPGADVAAEDRERLRNLVADLGSLPERQRGALVMRELSGLSYAEIGAALDASEHAARQIVYEAREAMRETGRARDADCAEIRRLISAGDGRVMRGRAVRAHLRGCERCEDYKAAISQRQADMRMLAPPLPAAAASGLLAAIVGGGGKAGLVAGMGSAGAGTGVGGTLGGIGGGLAGASAVAKGGAVLAALALGAGAGTVTGAVEMPFQGPPDSVPVAEQASPRATEATETARAVLGELDTGSSAAAHGEPGGRDGDGAASVRRDGDSGHRGDSARSAHAEGPSGVAPPDAVPPPPEQAVGGGVPASAGTGTGGSVAASERPAPPPPADAGAENADAGAVEPPDQAFGRADPNG